MTFTTCPQCDDSGVVFHPIVRVERTIIRDGREVIVTDKVGGPDACPVCAVNARTVWEQAIAE